MAMMKNRSLYYYHMLRLTICGSQGLLIISLLFLFLISGCATTKEQRVIAIVDGYPVLEQDLIYSITILHRREGLKPGVELNLLQYANKLIDERLLIEDARRMGMDESPAVKQKVDEFILRESIVKLREEEILKKISVSDEEIIAKYKNDEEEYNLGIIELENEEDAIKVNNLLKEGADFKELIEQYSTHISKKDGGNIKIRRKFMKPDLFNVVSGLKPGDISEYYKIDNKYYIAKLIERKEAADEDIEKFREGIRRALLKQKEADRSNEYLKQLKEKRDIKINRDILLEIRNVKFEPESVEISKWIKDKRNVVELEGYALTAGELVSMIMQTKQKRLFSAAGEFDVEKAAEDAINTWIDYRVVDIEALSRQYHKKTELFDRVESYRNQLMKDAYIRGVIIPKIKINDELLRNYYNNNPDKYLKPQRFRIQQITVQSMEEALEIEKSLKEGTDFSWLAKRRSLDPAKEKGGDVGWVSLEDFPESIRKEISGLNIGDISPIFKYREGFVIVKILEKSKKEIQPFEAVKALVQQEYFNEQFNMVYAQTIDELKKTAEIVIFDDVIKEIEDGIKNPKK